MDISENKLENVNEIVSFVERHSSLLELDIKGNNLGSIDKESFLLLFKNLVKGNFFLKIFNSVPVTIDDLALTVHKQCGQNNNLKKEDELFRFNECIRRKVY